MIYYQVDMSNYEERNEHLLDRKVIYGLANDEGKKQIRTNICNIIELDIEGSTYWFFYERP